MGKDLWGATSHGRLTWGELSPELRETALLPAIRGGHVVDRRFKAAYIRVLGKSFASKCRSYTRSGASLGALYESLRKYERDYPVMRSLPDWVRERLARAINAAYDVFYIPLRPLHINDVVVEPGTSPGASWRLFGRRGNKGDPSVDAEARARARTLLTIMSRGAVRFTRLPPCLAYYRTQLARVSKPKVRLVWGYPYEINLIEGIFAQAYEAKALGELPILPRTVSWVAYALDRVRTFPYQVGLDWSGFDSSVPPFLIKAVFGIIKSCFRESGDEYLRVLDQLEYYFIHTPIVMPDGQVAQKHGGIPSGSRFTAIVGSIVNWILIYAMTDGAAQSLHTVGDDSLFGLFERPNLNEYASFAKALGMRLSVEKSEVGKDVSFLGRRWAPGTTTRDSERLALLACLPERSGVPASDRAIGLLFDSALMDYALLAAINVLGVDPRSKGSMKEIPYLLKGKDGRLSVGTPLFRVIHVT